MKDRIREVREHFGLSMEKFGSRIGIGKTSISLLESGKNNPSVQTVSLICREFGVNEHWLRTGEGEMFSTLSREEEITKFAMEIIRDPDSEFQRQLLTTMARLEPAQWKLMEQMLDQLIRQRTAPPDKVPPPEDQ